MFIDELDRCRPDFSVQMLEVIKHTFNVPGVQFVLITNKQQLKAAINNSYGSQVDAQRYLDKFLKFSFQLVDTIPNKHTLDGSAMPTAEEHYLNLIKKSEILKESFLVGGNRSFITALIKQNTASLREVETFVRHCEIYHSLSNGFNLGIQDSEAILKIFGVYIFCLAPELSNAIEKNKLNAIDIMAYLGVQEVPETHRDRRDILAVLLAQESAINQHKFAIRDEDKGHWDRIKSSFQDGWGNPKRLQDEIQLVIQSLKLSSPSSY